MRTVLNFDFDDNVNLHLDNVLEFLLVVGFKILKF